ncbi:type II toxin-antitoxin system prevent-host-death family antitoxin [Fructobacillus sp. M1-13]|uniref:Antitoxin n=1 Tax=Fructobacillus papyriferae TaxID=2713171 RepID=A0ABS5QNI8_9LACO|nr:type II toxin-antitoxin system prevent-host-death family antitoxin [Fructobacillus papyriferae]MBS9334693.1 type II toxin-antitoxin system prevent-host-death family antitoxin [Fructobacillus papyriferae]MCD2158683.1 type II toxin-antitoxin system prevent-host-death family antitoxin [Fructobacillus papyriferae]
MQAISYSTVRNHLKNFMQKVNDDADAIMITSNRTDDNAVLLGQAEYENLVENAYIRSSSANVAHIKQSLQSLKTGNGQSHDWDS